MKVDLEKKERWTKEAKELKQAEWKQRVQHKKVNVRTQKTQEVKPHIEKLSTIDLSDSAQSEESDVTCPKCGLLYSSEVVDSLWWLSELVQLTSTNIHSARWPPNVKTVYVICACKSVSYKWLSVS